MDGDMSLFPALLFPLFWAGHTRGYTEHPNIGRASFPQEHSPFGVSGEAPVPVDCWHCSLTTRHGATHPAARSWHRALLPSQQRGKSTVAVPAAASPNLPACQSHTDSCNTTVWRCPCECHGHPMAAWWGRAPCRCSDLRCHRAVSPLHFPTPARRRNSCEIRKVCPCLQLRGWMSQHRDMVQDFSLSPCWSRQRLPCTGGGQTPLKGAGEHRAKRSHPNTT